MPAGVAFLTHTSLGLGTYYAFYGTGSGERVRPQGWAIDLRHHASWRKVQPVPGSAGDLYWNRLMAYQDKAYLFTGKQDLSVFDFKTEKWAPVST